MLQKEFQPLGIREKQALLVFSLSIVCYLLLI